MILEITQDDIDTGIKKSHTKCPLALALKRHFKKVAVRNFEVTVDGSILCMGANLQQFVTNFDNGQVVMPFEFEMAEPCQVMLPTNLNMRTR